MIESFTISSQAIAHNPQKNNAQRNVSVYLPPGYHQSQQAFPTVYLLHGSFQTDTLWMGKGYLKGINIKDMLDQLISDRLIAPMIVVMPNCKAKYSGSWYSDSTYTGNWEQFVCSELIDYIDNQYRTIPSTQARAIIGHSMGGYGAMKLGLKHPELFGTIYSMSGLLSIEEAFLGNAQRTKTLDACAAAWSPNLDKPEGYDLPFEGEPGARRKLPELWAKWEQHDPVHLLNAYQPISPQSIYFDCGEKDPLFAANQVFAEALKQREIDYNFAIFNGGHTSHTVRNLQDKVLPVISKCFTHQQHHINTTPLFSQVNSNAHMDASSIADRVKLNARACRPILS